MSEFGKPVERFDPVKQFATIRDNLTTAVSQALNLPTGEEIHKFPALNVYEGGDNTLIVRSQIIEGLDPNSLEVALEDGNLTISGVSSYSPDLHEGQYLVREIPNGPFSRSIRIPIPVSTEGIKANINKQGVVTVRFSKL